MTAQRKISNLVFDTNIFLTGVEFNIFSERIYTIPEVINEIKVQKYKEKNRNILNRIEVAVENGKLIIKKPDNEFIEIVKERAKKTGDFKILSTADIFLIALTLELSKLDNYDVILFTNDYSMENLCAELNIKYSPLFKDGIRKKVIFEVYCPYCKTVHNPEDLNKICERCGSILKRRPKKS